MGEPRPFSMRILEERVGMNHKQKDTLLHLLIALFCLALGAAGETGDCQEQEYRDKAGNCAACKQCGPGQELSKECGFGYGDDGQCVTCRPSRFKEDWGFQKCKPCSDCALVNRVQKANCTATGNAVCGDCLSGFYRKTKLGGFQEMECIPCGEAPPPYEPHWSMRLHDAQLNGAELSTSLDRQRINLSPHQTCAYCQQSPAQTCGPVHLVPSCCFDDTCSLEYSSESSYPPFASELLKRPKDSGRDILPSLLDVFTPSFDSDASEAWPLMRGSNCSDTGSTCESLHHPPDVGTAPEQVTALIQNSEAPTTPPSHMYQKEEGQPELLCLQSLSAEIEGTNVVGEKQEGAAHLGHLPSINHGGQEENQMECNAEQVPNADNGNCL
ncbi:tumor necrosis factor receptor superfamily member 19 isoform X3 [Rhinoraja longicauda]